MRDRVHMRVAPRQKDFDCRARFVFAVAPLLPPAPVCLSVLVYFLFFIFIFIFYFVFVDAPLLCSFHQPLGWFGLGLVRVWLGFG